MVLGLLLAGCARPGASSEVPATASPRAGASAAACRAAPAAVVSLLRSGLVVRGATLSNLFATRLGTPEEGSGASIPPFALHGWWIAGKITGAGVQPEVGVWVVSSIEAPRTSEVLAANAAAERYTRWSGVGTGQVTGPGLDAVVACVGFIPSP